MRKKLAKAILVGIMLILTTIMVCGCEEKTDDRPRKKPKNETTQNSEVDKKSGLLTGLFGNQGNEEETKKASEENQTTTEGFALDGKIRYTSSNGDYADVEVYDGMFDRAKMYDSKGKLSWSLDWGCDYVKEYDALEFPVGYTYDDGYIYSKIDANYELWVPFEYSEMNDPLAYVYVLLTDNTFRIYWIDQYRDNEEHYLYSINTFDFYR